MNLFQSPVQSPVAYRMHCLAGHAEICCNLGARTDVRSDSADLLVGKFPSRPPSSDAVMDVVRMSAYEQVLNASTGCSITCVSDDQPSRDGSVVMLPDDPMGEVAATVNADDAVSLSISVARVEKAFPDSLKLHHYALVGRDIYQSDSERQGHIQSVALALPVPAAHRAASRSPASDTVRHQYGTRTTLRHRRLLLTQGVRLGRHHRSNGGAYRHSIELTEVGS